MAEQDPFVAAGFELVTGAQPPEQPVDQQPAQPLEAEPEDPFTAAGYELVTQPTGAGQDQGLVEFTQGAIGGAVEAVPATAGLFTGVKVGATLGLPLGLPGVIGGGALGGLAGLAAGGYAGMETREALAGVEMPFTEGEPLTVLEAKGPVQVAGEAFGAGVGGMGSFMALARAGLKYGTNKIGNFFNRIIDSARKTPGTFLFAETAGSAGAAGGAYTADVLFPDDRLARTIGEISGGFLAPSRLLASPFSFIRNQLAQVSSVLPGRAGDLGARNKASQILLDLFEEFGEDPIAFRQALEAADISVTGPTVTAAVFDSPAMKALQARLVQMDAKFGAKSEEIMKANFENMRIVLDTLRKNGDPTSLRIAAEAEKRFYNQLLQSRLDMSEREIIDLAARMRTNSAESRSEVSVRAVSIAQDALDEARAVERSLWSAIDRNAPLRGEDVDIAAEIQSLKTQNLLRRDTLDPAIEGFLADVNRREELIAEGADEIPENLFFDANELLKLRTKSLELARTEGAAGNAAKANIYSTIAEVTVDSLNSLYGADQAYTTARAFSRELNDAFTRTYAGRVGTRQKTGAPRIAPEVALTQALSAGNEASALRFRQLSDATRFLETQNIVDVASAETYVSDMADAQETFVRLIVTETIDPDTGIPDATKLKTLLKNNSELLDRVDPDLKTTMQAAVRSSKKHAELVQQQQNTRIALKQTAFAKLLDVDSPSKAIAQAVNGQKPLTELTRLARLGAKNADTREGLASSVITFAFNSSLKNDGTIDFRRFGRALFDPVEDGGKSLAQIMQDNGILDAQTVGRIRQVLTAADRVKMAGEAVTPASVESLENNSTLVNYVARLGGATLSTAIPRALGINIGNAGIVQANIGSQTGRKILERIPANRTQQFLIQAMLDPKLMEMLLRQPTAVADRAKTLRQLHAYALTNGYLALSEEE